MTEHSKLKMFFKGDCSCTLYLSFIFAKYGAGASSMIQCGTSQAYLCGVLDTSLQHVPVNPADT